jgi:hypothetical protein
VAPTPRAVAGLTAWLAERDLPLADLRAGRERLEDVFLRLTGTDAPGEDLTATGATAVAAAGKRAGRRGSRVRR